MWTQLMDCLVWNLQRRFETDYIKTGLLTSKELDDITEVYY